MIVIDSNEAVVIEYCQQNKIPHVVEQIRFDGVRMGDISNQSRSFLVERKHDDFWNLAHTEKQLANMYTLENIRLFLWIQGTYEQFLESHEKASQQARRGGYQCPSLAWGHSLLTNGAMYQDLSVSFLSIKAMVEWAILLDTATLKEGEPLIRKTPKMESTSLTLLCSIKGIGKKLGEKLLQAFGNPLGVFLATDQEILAVPGIGESKLRSIRSYSEGV